MGLLSHIDILMPEDIHATTRQALDATFTTHFLQEAADPEQLLEAISPRIRGMARGNHIPIDRPLIERLPKLEIISCFGVGYDAIDLACVKERGIVVTNTPGVLTEEVADYTIGLLIMTLRELSAAERYLRTGEWAAEGKFPPTKGSLRCRTVGILGLGRIGLAITHRLDAMHVSVVYHTRTPRTDVTYRYYANLKAMAEAIDTLIVVLPGGAATKNLVNAEILQALGSRGVLINIGRGSAVDESALIEALRSGTIQACGLDVFENEPHVSPALLSLDNAVLLPHAASASMHTHDAMGQLLIDNLKSWFSERKPLTPVAETPWPPMRAN